jgi:hypothetical protein
MSCSDMREACESIGRGAGGSAGGEGAAAPAPAAAPADAAGGADEDSGAAASPLATGEDDEQPMAGGAMCSKRCEAGSRREVRAEGAVNDSAAQRSSRPHTDDESRVE